MAAGGRNSIRVTRLLSQTTQRVAGSTLVDTAEGLLLAFSACHHWQLWLDFRRLRQAETANCCLS